MKILILGASGQLGRCVTSLLKNSTHQIYAPSTDLFKIPFQSGAIKSLVAFNPGIILNLAAYTNVDLAEIEKEKAWSINTDGISQIYEIAIQNKSQIIHISSDYVFSGKNSVPWKIDDPKYPETFYGKTKLEAEKILLEKYPDNSVILRTAWLYSEYGENFAKKILKKILMRENLLKIVDDQIGQPTSAYDLSVFINEIINAEISSGIFHATNSGKASWFDFAKKIKELSLSTHTEVIPIKSDALKSKTKRPEFSVLSHEGNFQSNLLEMRDWEKALEECFPKILNQTKKEISIGS